MEILNKQGEKQAMAKGKPFECEITISSGVEQKLLKKHNIELWEIEEVVYDDSYAFSIT